MAIVKATYTKSSGGAKASIRYIEHRLHREVPWVAAEHNDHAPHRHVHIVAVVPGRLQPQDFQSMRKIATEAAVAQRQERDLARQMQKQQEQEAQWELQR